MKKILVPTDFSKQAEHAARFALFLAKKLNAQVVLHHSYVIPVYATDIPLALPSDLELEKSSQAGLETVQRKLKSEFPGVAISTVVSEGFAEEAVARSARENSADLIVMGTKGASGLREALVGTVTASAMEQADCPVIAVPEEADWSHFDRILYATSYEEGDLANVEDVVSIARSIGAEVILLHISSGKYDRTYEFDAMERFAERLKEDTGYVRITFKLLDDEDVVEGISDYAVAIKADMVVMTMRHRSLLNRIFERSKTKRMAFHTHVPLMAYHSQRG